MKRTKMMLMVLAAFLLMAFTAAQADVIVLATAPLGGSIVDWSTTGLPVNFQAHGFIGYATNGDTATATVAGLATGPSTTKGQLVVQGSTCPWCGNFSTGEYAIWTRNHGPLTISFGNSYNFVGGYFQQNTYGPFTAKMEVFSGNTVLGSVTLSGVSGFAPGTAIFIGAKDLSGPNITKVVFSETTGSGLADFAIGTLYLGVPEPGTLVLLGTGLIGLAGLARRRSTR